ncbi:hypothetical protein [Halobacterium yunchengense]|uniref:hypothetical protein n=1 Tax=Halobacterium yunchengense TaxID=3108497 RepID=UPI003008C1D8
MNGRRAVAALGAGLAVFLVVAVAVVEALAFEFSALVGLPVGLVAGAVVAGYVALRYSSFGRRPRAVADALAGFGLAVLAAQALSYVNLAGLRSALSTDLAVALAVAVGVLAGAASWRRDGRA